MNSLQLARYVRSLLGRSFSVADEEGALDARNRLVIVRRGKEEVLTVELTDSWIQQLNMMPSPEDRVLLKHLAICIRRFFLYPEAIRQPIVFWPGTPESRLALRLALDPRKHR